MSLFAKEFTRVCSPKTSRQRFRIDEFKSTSRNRLISPIPRVNLRFSHIPRHFAHSTSQFEQFWIARSFRIGPTTQLNVMDALHNTDEKNPINRNSNLLRHPTKIGIVSEQSLYKTAPNSWLVKNWLRDALIRGSNRLTGVAVAR